ncbi:endoplasmic reticulum to nucleus signalling 1, isoform CRA_a [Homo sapiens]|nr:endoplasmic reticulum to nucleus signalling 1, isoform CRA_a [Homo sapiens]
MKSDAAGPSAGLMGRPGGALPVFPSHRQASRLDPPAPPDAGCRGLVLYSRRRLMSEASQMPAPPSAPPRASPSHIPARGTPSARPHLRPEHAPRLAPPRPRPQLRPDRKKPRHPALIGPGMGVPPLPSQFCVR